MIAHNYPWGEGNDQACRLVSFILQPIREREPLQHVLRLTSLICGSNLQEEGYEGYA
jgi:hypothetical protein